MQAVPPPPQPLDGQLAHRRARARSSAQSSSTKITTRKISPPGVVIPDVEVMRRSLSCAASDMGIDDELEVDLDTAPNNPQPLKHLIDQWAYESITLLMEYHDVPGILYSKTLDWFINKLNCLVVSTCFSGCDAPGTSIWEI